MKAKRIKLGPMRTKYRDVPKRDEISHARVAGGGIYESDPIERIDAATRREERHRLFEEHRESVRMSVVNDSLRASGVARVRRALRKLRRVVIRGNKADEG